MFEIKLKINTDMLREGMTKKSEFFWTMLLMGGRGGGC